MKYVAIIDANTCQVIEMVKQTDDSLGLMQFYLTQGRRVHRKLVDSKVHDEYLLHGAQPMYAKPIQGYGTDVSGYVL